MRRSSWGSGSHIEGSEGVRETVAIHPHGDLHVGQVLEGRDGFAVTDFDGAIFDPRLLRPFEVEQECRELLYAARFLPRWRYAAMGVLRSWFDDA
jgi:hypothetical protein